MEASIFNIDTDKVSAIMKLLETKYHGDFSHYCDAEKEIDASIRLKNQLKSLKQSVELCSKKFNTDIELNKYTYVDLKNRKMWIEETNNDGIDALLAYSYDYITVRRIFPYSLNLFFDKSYNVDKYKAKTTEQQDKAIKVLQWTKNRVLNLQFQLSSMSLNKKTGVLTYNTSTRDANFGTTMQYITAVIDPTRLVNIPNLGITDKAINLAQDYNTLFNYFIMFGFTEFYARCNCSDYYKKYSRRRGTQNYFCSHILYALTQFPWYASVYLNK